MNNNNNNNNNNRVEAIVVIGGFKFICSSFTWYFLNKKGNVIFSCHYINLTILKFKT